MLQKPPQINATSMKGDKKNRPILLLTQSDNRALREGCQTLQALKLGFEGDNNPCIVNLPSYKEHLEVAFYLSFSHKISHLKIVSILQKFPSSTSIN